MKKSEARGKRLKVGQMLAVSLSGTLSQAESLALCSLRKPSGISRSHSPDEQAPLAFRFRPSIISRLPFTFIGVENKNVYGNN